MESTIRIWVCVLTLLVSSSGVVQAAPETAVQNVLLVVLDATGAKHLKHEGAPRSYTPTIDGLAKLGTKFTHSVAVAPWTKPSVASILTGLMPSLHGVTTTGSKLSSGQITVAEILKEHGFATLGVTSHTFLSERAGYSQGFDEFYQVNDQGNTHSAITSQLVSEKVISWIKSKADKKRFFIMAHFFDPHFSFRHHPEFDLTSQLPNANIIRTKQSPNATYRRKNVKSQADLTLLRLLQAEEISYSDHHIGKIVAELKAHKLLDKTLVIVTADHGEEFWEHGALGHTSTLYDELLRIPLVVYSPLGKMNNLIETPVSQLDLLPTILDCLGITSTIQGLSGRSLKSIIDGEQGNARNVRQLYSEVSYKTHKGVVEFNKISVFDQPWKLILDRNNRQYELYNLKVDPQEKINRVKEAKEVFERLAKLLEGLDQQHAQADSVKNTRKKGEIDYQPEEVEQLKTLGYL